MPPGLLTGADSTAFHTLAARRGGETVATAMAERIYAAVGFRDLGRILEFVP